MGHIVQGHRSSGKVTGCKAGISTLQVATLGASRQNIRENTHFWYSLGSLALASWTDTDIRRFWIRLQKKVVDKFCKSLCTQSHGFIGLHSTKDGDFSQLFFLHQTDRITLGSVFLLFVCVTLSLCLLIFLSSLFYIPSQFTFIMNC